MRSNLSNLRALVTLPPEIMDNILEQIPANDEGRPTLIACALVAIWWTGPSQRRLFSSVDIHEVNYERWMNGAVLSGSKTRLLGFVRSLSYLRGFSYPMRDLVQDFGEYFSALRNLHSLTLFNTTVEHLSEEEFRTCFSAFRETLTCLSLDTIATKFSAFVALVGYFPNITSLKLNSFALEPDEGPVPSLTQPLRGKLRIRVQVDSPEFFDRFAKLNLEYEELVLGRCCITLMETKSLGSALRISASTVKFLRLTCQFRFRGAVTIQDFRRLRELELVVIWPKSRDNALLISSITSTELRKITFLVKYMRGGLSFARRMGQWDFVDDRLCGLVDLLRAKGHRHTLEVELRLMKYEGDPTRVYDFSKFLPGFREKGVVTIIDTVHNDRLLHSSTHNR